MDKRVYNGCPNNELMEYLRNEQRLENKLKNEIPGAWLTYFPGEEMWMAHVWGKPLSSMKREKIDAILEALQKNK